MSNPSRRRLLNDYKKYQREGPSLGVIVKPRPENMMDCECIIMGPDDTEWEGGVFKLIMEFTDEFPSKPPKVKFITQMFHPNIYTDGKICLDILDKSWTPIYDFNAILTSIQSLLSDPNPDSPANQEAARLFTEADGDVSQEYYYRVRQCVENSWVHDPSQIKS